MTTRLPDAPDDYDGDWARALVRTIEREFYATQVAGQAAALAVASGTSLGGVKVGATLKIVAAVLDVSAIDATAVTTGSFPPGRLGTGTPTSGGVDGKFLRGDGSWATIIPTDIPSGVFAPARLGSGTPTSGGADGKFLRGDGSWATIVPTDVPSGVFNVARLGTGTPTSGGADGKFLKGTGAWATITPADIPSGVFAPARLGSGTPGSTNYLRGDGSWATPPGPHDFAVSDYGAVGDGTTDDTADIQAAINAAALVGGDVYFAAKTYKITSTLFVGNGSATAISTYGNVRLIGTGIPPMPPQFLTGLDSMNRKATYLRWAGATGGTMVQIRGPLQGWGVSNIFFDGANGGTDFAGFAGIGLYVVSAQFGYCENLSFRGCRSASIQSSTVAAPSGVSVSDSLSNTYTNINIGMGWVTGVKGIVLTGVSPAGSNTDYNSFTNITIAMPTTSSIVAYGIYFASCDSNTFTNVHLMNGHSNCIGVMFDYAINPDWPAGNQIYGIDWGGLAGPVQTGATPSTTARPNYIYAVNECNGGFMPPDVKNVVTSPGIMATHYEVGLTATKANQVLYTPFRTGLYRIHYYLLVTGGNAGGGNIDITFSWLDGTGTPAVTSDLVQNGPGNWTSGSLVVQPATATQILWAANTHSLPAGTTIQYSVALSVERLF